MTAPPGPTRPTPSDDAPPSSGAGQLTVSTPSAAEGCSSAPAVGPPSSVCAEGAGKCGECKHFISGKVPTIEYRYVYCIPKGECVWDFWKRPCFVRRDR